LPVPPLPLLVAIALLVAPRPGATQCLVREANDDEYTGSNSTSGHVLVQSFVALQCYELDAVEVSVSAASYPVGMRVRVQDTPSATPSVVYTESSVPVSAAGFVYCDLPDVPIRRGDVYYIWIEDPGTVTLAWRTNHGQYPAGNAWIDGSAAMNMDFLFRTCAVAGERCLVRESYDPPGWDGGLHAMTYTIAQSFRPTTSYHLDGIELLIDHQGPTTVTAFIQDTPDLTPTLILAIGSATTAGPGFAFLDMGGAPISAGETYYIRLGGNTEWMHGHEAPYTGGSSFVDGQLSASDFVFRTCATATPVEGRTWGSIKHVYR
jgi:hypothetical protein